MRVSQKDTMCKRHITQIFVVCVGNVIQLTRVTLSEVPCIEIDRMASIDIGINRVTNIRSKNRP